MVGDVCLLHECGHVDQGQAFRMQVTIFQLPDIPRLTVNRLDLLGIPVKVIVVALNTN